jgi:hypothetical protein
MPLDQFVMTTGDQWCGVPVGEECPRWTHKHGIGVSGPAAADRALRAYRDRHRSSMMTRGSEGKFPNFHGARLFSTRLNPLGVLCGLQSNMISAQSELKSRAYPMLTRSKPANHDVI